MPGKPFGRVGAATILVCCSVLVVLQINTATPNESPPSKNVIAEFMGEKLLLKDLVEDLVRRAPREVAELEPSDFRDAERPEQIPLSAFAGAIEGWGKHQIRKRMKGHIDISREHIDAYSEHQMAGGQVLPFTEARALYNRATNKALKTIREEDITDPEEVRQAFQEARENIDEFPGFWSEERERMFYSEEAWEQMVESAVVLTGAGPRGVQTWSMSPETEEEWREELQESIRVRLQQAKLAEKLMQAYKLEESVKHMNEVEAYLRRVDEDYRERTGEGWRVGEMLEPEEALYYALREREWERYHTRMLMEHLLIHDEEVAAELENRWKTRLERPFDHYLRRLVHFKLPQPMTPWRE